VDTEGSTPLHVAAYNGHAGAIIAMLGGLLPEHHLAAMMVPNMFRRTPLHEAAYNGRVNAITTMLARLNVAQCRDALFNLEYGVGTKLAQEYAKNAQHADAQRYLDTLINGVVPLIPFGNDKKELITGILQKVTEINPQAQIPSAAVKYLDTPKTVGGYLQGLQGSFAQAATADTTTVPGKDHTPGAKGDTGVHKCKMRRIRYGCEPRS
jgi:ankyrin repeat protein